MHVESMQFVEKQINENYSKLIAIIGNNYLQEEYLVFTRLVSFSIVLHRLALCFYLIFKPAVMLLLNGSEPSKLQHTVASHFNEGAN